MRDQRHIARGRGIMGLVLAGLCVGAIASDARAESGDGALAGMSVVGINRDTGNLWRYDFPDGEVRVIGTVEDPSGRALHQLGATAWFEDFGGVYGFRREPGVHRMGLVYVNLETGMAREEGVDLGPGAVRGAAAAVVPDEDAPRGRRWRVFAMQEDLGLEVEGRANINPNNSQHSEFVLEKPNGERITRDDLHRGETDKEGVYYAGEARMLRLKPKGNANRNTFMVDGQPYLLHNGRTYYFEAQPGAGPMEAVIYNTHPNSRDGGAQADAGGATGKAGQKVKNKRRGNNPMGHWWVEIRAGSATVGRERPGNGGERVYERPMEPQSRLVRVETGPGAGEESGVEVMEPVMELERDYAGLDTDEDGETFHAVHDGDVYRIDPESGTETRVSEPAIEAVVGLQRTEETLVGVVQDGEESLAAIDAGDGAWLSDSIDVGSEEAGATVLIPTDSLPSPERVAVD